MLNATEPACLQSGCIGVAHSMTPAAQEWCISWTGVAHSVTTTESACRSLTAQEWFISWTGVAHSVTATESACRSLTAQEWLISWTGAATDSPHTP